MDQTEIALKDALEQLREAEARIAELEQRDALQQGALRVIAAATDPAHWEAPPGVTDLGTFRNIRATTADLKAALDGDANAREQRLSADNARLRKLIAEAEWEGSVGQDPEPACPWCGAEQGFEMEPEHGEHRAGCEAFSAPGVVR